MVKNTGWSLRGLSAEERFWRQTNTEGECWVWVGYCNGKGRPVITVNGKQVYAHRYAYGRFIGMVPPGEYVCHFCDNIKCVNPSHLFKGTQDDNMKDMKSKGRANKPKGVRNGRAKLDDDKVRFIRNCYTPRHRKYGQSALARQFGVCVLTIQEVLDGRKWKHVT